MSELNEMNFIFLLKKFLKMIISKPGKIHCEQEFAPNLLLMQIDTSAVSV
jgi:hypothetical protein